MRFRIAVLGALALAACLPYDSLGDVHPELLDRGASAAHWLGTDHLGRDVLRRTLSAGTAVALPSLVAVPLAGLIGGAAGAAAGWYGGATAAFIRAFTGAISAVPGLGLVMLVLLVTRPGPLSLGSAAAVVAVPPLVDGLAGKIEELRRQEFVVAARGHGVPDGRILAWHLLWVHGRPLFVSRLLGAVGTVLTVEITLSYLGELGVTEPTPSWGNMIAHAMSTGCTNPLALAAPVVAALLTLAASLPLPGASWTR